jgi:predicted PurR-regulated permease PerM
MERRCASIRHRGAALTAPPLYHACSVARAEDAFRSLTNIAMPGGMIYSVHVGQSCLLQINAIPAQTLDMAMSDSRDDKMAVSITSDVLDTRNGNPVPPGETNGYAGHANGDTAGAKIHIPVDARGLALTSIATIAIVFALYAAHAFFIPLLFGIFIAYTLNPVVVWLERIHIPRLIGTSLLLIAIVSSGIVTAVNLRDEFNSILLNLPAATQKLSRAVRAMDTRHSALQQMQAAANEIEKATNQAAGVRPARPAQDQSIFNVNQWLLVGSVGVLTLLAQATMVVFLVFFFLLSGDTFKRKLVKISGRALSTRKITVHILEGINKSIQNYMFMLLVTNMLFALSMWGALEWIGLANAGAWAVAAGFLHIIPYFGPLLIIGAAGVTAFMQFGTFASVFAVAGATLAISIIIGTFVTTWMTGRIAKMNAAAVFVSLLFWAWLWGIWGMLLGIPIVVILKVVAEHVEGMQQISEILGE